VALWFAGLIYWLAIFHWLTLPHWATSFGWLGVGIYHAFYLPVFVGLSRVAVHGLRVPLMLAAPIVWTGLEYARAYLLTGITMASLGHTQFRWIELIQISDLTGAYGVSFVVMFVAACLARMLPWEGSRASTWPLVPLMVVMGGVLTYGFVRSGPPAGEPVARMALIQGSIDTQFDAPEDTPVRAFEQYRSLSREAISQHGPVDLLVWPETMYRFPLVIVDDNATPPPEYSGSAAEFRDERRQWADESRRMLALTARYFDTPMILGVDVWHFRAGRAEKFNSALHVDNDGSILGRYDKMHLVIFGEYVPFAGYAPILQRFTPLPFSLDAGDQPGLFTHRGLRLSPSICYENVLPQVTRRQVTQTPDGNPPDVLVNLTNDGWFWGSAELDMHLVCGAFRAVETRKPTMIAANTGFSAFIDGDGRIVEQGPRRQTRVLVAEVRPDNRSSPYMRYGDWPAGACLAATGLLAAVGLVSLRRRRRRDFDVRLAD
jgi:apolipoprotein N-acyltransferase